MHVSASSINEHTPKEEYKDEPLYSIQESAVDTPKSKHNFEIESTESGLVSRKSLISSPSIGTSWSKAIEAHDGNLSGWPVSLKEHTTWPNAVLDSNGSNLSWSVDTTDLLRGKKEPAVFRPQLLKREIPIPPPKVESTNKSTESAQIVNPTKVYPFFPPNIVEQIEKS